MLDPSEWEHNYLFISFGGRDSMVPCYADHASQAQVMEWMLTQMRYPWNLTVTPLTEETWEVMMSRLSDDNIRRYVIVGD